MKNKLKIIIVVVVAIILISTAFLVLYHPTEPFTDTSQACPPEELDPATGFFISNGPLFAATFQSLVAYNGSLTSVVPILASHYTNINDTHYLFDMRNGAKFSNGQSLNATSVWFSLARGIVMGQGPFSSDYSGTLFNATMAGITGIYLPVNITYALVNAGYNIPMVTYHVNSTLTITRYNYTIAATDLADMLSNFNYNTTEMKVMEYPNQALVVNTNGTFTINTEHEYAYLLSDLAGGSWGDIVEPSYVDAHGGVQVNTPSSYIDANGAIGSGPYVISSVVKGFSTIVLKANPDYWVTSAMVKNGSISVMAEPASIKTVVIDYGLSHADRLEDFDKGISQISTIAPSSFKSMIDGFHNKTERTGALVKSFSEAGTYYISMNVADNYTNNTNFREALYDAMNYSAQLKIYDNNYNSTPEAYAELGPLSPIYGHAFYNPDNLPMPSQNITAALKNISIAGDAMHFYVKLSNGTRYGDKTGTDLSTHTFTLTAISPATSIETAQLSSAISSFEQIGLAFTTKLVTDSIADTYTTNNSTPQFYDIYWLPDYPDPIG
jgi:ABC-type transport system substrate-binding protein